MGGGGRERGQALAEGLLALPLLLYLGLGLIQLGVLAWQRALLQHAANCAARSYTVWRSRGEEAAQLHALRAARLALRPGLEPESLSATAGPHPAFGLGARAGEGWAGKDERLLLVVELKGRWPPLLALPPWRGGLALKARALILNETTKERQASKG